MTPKVLLYDIEIAPIVGTTWQLYDTNVVWTVQEWYILCFAYKWLGERQTYVVSQTDFKGHKSGSNDDKAVVTKLWDLMNLADVVIAHNGNSFDQKKMRARVAYHKLGPHSPFQQIDTLRVARKEFGFSSNKLDDLGEFLGLGRKKKVDKDLWRDCMAGETRAWKKMMAYNKQDVILLEKVYLELRPYMTNHPNISNIQGRPSSCPVCGVEGFMWAQGFRITKTGRYRRWQCKACGSFVSNRNQEKGERPQYV